MSSSSSPDEIKSLTGIRWVAAFYVFIFHCQIHLGRAFSWKPLASFIDNGATAMSLFFILSGWILTHVYNTGSFDIRDFYLKRFSRIYPCYFAYGLFSIPMIFLQSIEYKFMVFGGTLRDVINFIYALFLFIFMLQAWLPSLFGYWNFGGSWSLSVEAFFYLLFPFFRQLLNGVKTQTLNLMIVLVFIFSIAPFLGFYLFSQETDYNTIRIMIYDNPMLRLPEFLLGMMGYILTIEHKNIILASPKIFTGLFVFFIVFLSIPLKHISYGLYSFICVPFFLSFIASAHLSKGFLSLFLGNSIMQYLGKISYSFYLSQFVSFGLFKGFLIKNNENISIRWACSFILTLVVSVIVYHFIEVPFRKRLRSEKGSFSFILYLQKFTNLLAVARK
jgi:peptidoglycan/LPS O-acetylase OafA/YrhL